MTKADRPRFSRDAIRHDGIKQSRIRFFRRRGHAHRWGTKRRWPDRYCGHKTHICLVAVDILKLVFVERLFSVSRNKLMSIPAFA
jgi:hypothetical protein